jgi:hypothetical protein
MTRISHTLFFALLISLASSTALAQKYERKVEKRIDVQPNAAVHIDGKFGPVTVTGADQNVVAVRIVITAEDDSYEEAKKRAEEVEVIIDESHGGVRIATDFSEHRSNKGRQSLNASITVTVPKQAILELRNKFGSSKATGVDGSVSMVNEFGSAVVTNCSNVRMQNAFGSSNASAIRGTLNIESKNGQVRAFDVPACTIRNAFGEIDLSDAHGPVQITGRMGTIKARGIPGGSIENSYGSVSISLERNFSGIIEAKTKFGSVDSDFPLEPRVKRSEKQYGPVPEDLIGRIGNGSARLQVLNEFGEITIKKK